MVNTIKVVSLNLWGGKLLDEAIAYIKEQDPDILLLQEVYSTEDKTMDKRYGSLETLTAALAQYTHRYAPAFSAGYLDGKVKAGNATFSKFPISANEVTFFDVPYAENWEGAIPPGDFRTVPRNMQHTVVTHPELGDIDVLNVHGIWDFRGRDTERRLA